MPPARKSLKEVFLDIYKGNFKHAEIEATLTMSVDDLYNLFKDLKGDELQRVIDGALFWRRVSNATEQQKSLTQRVLQALERIGRQSPLNAKRMAKFGLKLGPGNDAVASSEC